MEFDEFVAPYRREPGRYPSYPTELEARLVDVRRLAVQWGEILHDALALGQAPPLEQIRAFSLTYTAWANAGFGGVSGFVERWVDSRADSLEESDAAGITEFLDDLALLSSELSFHRLNAHAGTFWASFLCGIPGLAGREIVESTCFHLAREVLTFAEYRNLLIEDDLFFGDEARIGRAMHTGALTEIDAYIALLDLTRRNRRLIVLPGPPQFERWAGSANADFLVIDTERGSIRGVQVKSMVERREVERYDPARITLIDGARDLQNSRAMRTDPRRSDRRVVSWPGMIGAHYLRELKPGPLTDRWIERRSLLLTKYAAVHYAGAVGSQNKSAYAAVRERVIHDLSSRPAS
ncbi:hypothetical protein KVF89_05830 [Nocardioides carbamazepini]|uniref:hypothetical protein n=1 Tax=Nocardioides carbamazepini TaxID=2854259 RepID=UPI002149C7CE|nr:hypothetical protein [Nocardioides carbamazepini]MCR1782047.1 hypothetical protein [Nocardioides carbamazepini]